MSTQNGQVTIMRFTPNGSPKTIVFGDVKMSRKFEGFHPARQFSTGTFILELGQLGKTNTFAIRWPQASCGQRARFVFVV